MTVAEGRFVILLVGLWILAAFIAFDPFDTVSPSYRAGGLLVTGPILGGYGINGLVRGSFREMEQADRDGTKWKFWFCAVSYIALGLGATFAGVDAVFGLGIIT